MTSDPLARAPDRPIREARPADEPALRRLQSHLHDPTPELLEYGLTVGTTLVTTADAEADRKNASGLPVGYLLAVHGENAHVAELAVAPAYRREGRAASLLSALFDRLAAGERVTLTVAPTNEAALALYESVGFERIERRENFFSTGPALILAREK